MSKSILEKIYDKIDKLEKDKQDYLEVGKMATVNRKEEEIENAKQCLNEIIQNTYAEGKAKKLDTLRKYIKELEQKESILDKVTDKLKERIKELDNLKENYIKLKEYDQVDFTLCKKREVQNILNIIEGDKEVYK